MSLLIILSSVASIVCLIVALIVCLCCYKRHGGSDDDSDYDELDKDPPVGQDEERGDVKKLKKHPWQERMDSRPAPFIAKKSIRFERPPDKVIESQNVQPNQYSQSSLNRSLGVRNNRDIQNANTLGAVREGNNSSASNSPFHSVTRSGGGRDRGDNNDSSGADGAAGAMAMDDIPIVEDPYYPPAPGEKLGKIQFMISYNFQEMTLTLKIMRAVDLPAKDFSGTSDPYVKILLLPDKKSKLTTNIKRKNLNPRWNEIFAFEGFPYSKLMSRTLYLQVLDYDRFSRDDPIGEICIPLSDVDLAQGQTMWRNLQPCKGHTGKLGELLVSLCYQPSVGRLTVVVLKARELKAKDINGYSDPYVKIWLLNDGKKEEKKKTTTKEKNLNPVFNESFIFNVSYEKIRHTSLRISVMDYDRMGRNELIGEILLGSKSGPMEVKHWNEMFAKSRQPVAQWHILKDFG